MNERQRDPYGVAYAALRSSVTSERWHEGDKLNLVQIASDLRLSPTPVREAVSRLVGEELIEYRPLQGYFVPQLRTKQIEDLLWLWEAISLHVFDALDESSRSIVVAGDYDAPLDIIEAVLATSESKAIVRTADLARARLTGVLRVEDAVLDLASERRAMPFPPSVSGFRKVMAGYFRARRRSAAKLRSAREREDERRKQISEV